MNYHYRFCGLLVSSEIELPNLPTVDGDPVSADVRFTRGPVADDFGTPAVAGPNWQVSGDRILLKVPGVARFAMIGGRELRCALEPGVEESHAIVFLLGSAFGILLHQRGGILLHAAVVAVGDRAIAFSGASGAGKSTLAAALCEATAGFLSDDICLIRTEAGKILVQQDGRRLKLWADAIGHLNVAPGRHGAVRPSIEKFFVEPPLRCTLPEVPLAAVYLLHDDRLAKGPRIEQPKLAEAAMLLRGAAYRPRLVHALDMEQRYFAANAAIIGTVPIFRLTRPKDFGVLPATLRCLEAHWHELGFMS